LSPRLGIRGGDGADDLRPDAQARSERSVNRDVRLSADGAAVELDERERF
jgi:hypothetical protein